MPVDEKSSYLHMPLPHEANTLDQDLTRLRAAFDHLDSHAQSSDAAQAALKSELEARDDALQAGLERAHAYLTAHLAAENPHPMPVASRHALGLAQVGQGIDVEQGVISVPPVPPASAAAPGLMQPDNVTCAVSESGVLSVLREELAFTGYLTEFRSFFEQGPPLGWAVRNGAVLENADTAYPALWAALHAEKNAWKCKTPEEWDALSAAAGGVGGVPFFVLDEDAKTVQLPDTRGDYARDAGSAFLEAVGAWHGDAVRNITGYIDLAFSWNYGGSGVFYSSGSYGKAECGINGTHPNLINFDASRVVPTASENRVRTFGLLPCVYIGGDQ